MKNIHKHGIHFQVFDSIQEFVGLKPKHTMNDVAIERLRKDITKSWVGTDNLEELEKICKYGWDKGVKKAKRYLNEVPVPSLPSPRRKRRKGMQGLRLDPVSVNNGSLRPWEKMIKVDSDKFARKGMTTIVVNLGTSGNISSGQYFWRGAVALNMAEAMIKAGRKVRIVALDPTRIYVDGSNYRFTPIIEVKRFEDSLNKAKLFSILSFAGMYRVYYFQSCFCLDGKVPDPGAVDYNFRMEDHLDWYMQDTSYIEIKDIFSKDAANYAISKMVSDFHEQRMAMCSK